MSGTYKQRAQIKDMLNSVKEKTNERMHHIQCLEYIRNEAEFIRDLTSSYIDPEKVEKASLYENVSRPTENRAVKIVDKYALDEKYRIDSIQKLSDEIESIVFEVSVIFSKKSSKDNSYKAIKLRFFDFLSINEIAAELNYSPSWVSKLISAGIDYIVDYKYS